MHEFYHNCVIKFNFKTRSKVSIQFYCDAKVTTGACFSPVVLHQLDQKIIYPHYDFKHLTEKYFEIGMKLDDFLIQLVKYCPKLLRNS